MPVRLLLPRQLYNEMLAQAVVELPNECCGLLAGRMEEQPGTQQAVWRVLRRYPLVNKAASPVEYLADDRSLFDAYRDMRKLELAVLAVYHSHPTSEPVPSRKDRERYYPDLMGEVVHFIVSLRDHEPQVRGWWLSKSGHCDADWQCMDS